MPNCSQLMTHDPVCCLASDTVDRAAQSADNDLQLALDAMAGHQVRRIPVVDDKNQVVGIISQSDVATRVSEPARTAELVKEISKSGRKSSAAGRLL